MFKRTSTGGWTWTDEIRVATIQYRPVEGHDVFLVRIPSLNITTSIFGDQAHSLYLQLWEEANDPGWGGEAAGSGREHTS